MDDRPFFYRLRGRTLGPVGLRQIRQLAQRAQIGRTTDVSRDGVQWAKATDFPEIFDVSGGFEPPPAGVGGGELIMSGDPGGFGGGSPPPLMAGPRWFYTVGGSQQGPVDEATLRQLVASGNVPCNEHAIPEGGMQWMPIGSIPQFASAGGGFAGQGPIINVNSPRPNYPAGQHRPAGAKNKGTAALLGFFLGSFGVHRFYLGDTGLGVLFLLTCGVCGIGSLIDTIILIAMSERDFDAKYNQRRS